MSTSIEHYSSSATVSSKCCFSLSHSYQVSMLLETPQVLLIHSKARDSHRVRKRLPGSRRSGSECTRKKSLSTTGQVELRLPELVKESPQLYDKKQTAFSCSSASTSPSCCSSTMARAASRYRELLLSAMILSLALSILSLPQPIQKMTKGPFIWPLKNA